MTTSKVPVQSSRKGSGIIISSYRHLDHVVQLVELTAAVSMLGRTDRLEWPTFSVKPVLQLAFDDASESTNSSLAATPDHVRQLIEFSRAWNGRGHLLLHCRGGVSRSPAAAMVAAAAIGRTDLLPVIAQARAYFSPNLHVLEIADNILGSSTLTDCLRALPTPDREDPWEPVLIPTD